MPAQTESNFRGLRHLDFSLLELESKFVKARDVQTAAKGQKRTLQIYSKSIMKLALMCLVVLLTGCGTVTSQSIYEGLRTQQNVQDAGISQPPEEMGTYGAYEKEREKLRPQE